MKIWGTSKKQRLWVFISLLVVFTLSAIWGYYNIKHDIEDMTSIFITLITSFSIIVYTVYLIIDNTRSDVIRFTISTSKPLLDRATSRFNLEFNDIVCRSHIASIIKELLESESSKKYNYIVTDVTTAVETDKQQSKFTIYADNQHRATYIIMPNNETILI